MKPVNKHPILLIIYLFLALLLCSCSSLRTSTQNDDLPILSQDELIRPYIKLGRIQVTRETYGSDYSLSPEIKEWGLAAVRQEAGKMGADAIMFPEVTGRVTTYGIIPSTEYIASAFAIKFK
jgi:hypothetical protein